MVPELLGLIGTVIVFAGIHMLWQARNELFYWIETYLRIFRAALRQPGAPVPRSAAAGASRQHENTFRILLGFGLLFFLGPALIVLGLTL